MAETQPHSKVNPDTTAINDLYLGENYGNVNVIENYRWTLSQNFNKSEVPKIILIEFKVDESTIKTQIGFYASAVGNAIFNDNKSDPLLPYKNLFPKDKPTNNQYIFPYFSEVNFDLTTPEWGTLDTLPQMAKGLEGLAGVFGGEKAAAATGAAIGAIAKGAGVALGALYPQVGIMDRPRLWQSHGFRNIEVKFPLFNTYDPKDWIKNRELVWTLVNSNLFQKRDFITGSPPVFYEVRIPGQLYSYAACVTNLKIYNRGNMRMLKDKSHDVIVPDAYEVVMTLTDMTMPSRNLHQAAWRDDTVIAS